MRPSRYLIAIFGAALAVAACANPPTAPSVNPFAYNDLHRVLRKNATANVITKVFVIVQENRTVDNLFNGLPNADTQSWGMSGGQRIVLQPTPMAVPAQFDFGHFLSNFNQDTGCPINGPYVLNGAADGPCPMNGFSAPTSDSPGAYAYVEKKWTAPYWAMAKQYAFGDHMFQSNLDGSYVSHQYLVAAQANRATNFPNMENGCHSTTGYSPTVPWIEGILRSPDPNPESACMDYKTIATELASASPSPLPWRYYAATNGTGIAWWEPFQWIKHQQTNWPGGSVILNPKQFLKDIGSTNAYNPVVTWICPSRKNSDHAGVTLNTSASWVAAVVNAIGTSQYWDHSVIFVIWDDWGGWYDHVQPPYADYDGLGNRVPFIIISPYTKKGLVTHTQYEQASILKYIEDRFNLGQLSASDTRAADPEPDVMSNPGSTPRPFTKIGTYYYSYYSGYDPGSPDSE
jgi:phospholipase C